MPGTPRFKAIARDAASALHAWLNGPGRDVIAPDGEGLTLDNARLAFLFDALHRQHFQASWNKDALRKLPSREVLLELYKEAHGVDAPGFLKGMKDAVELMLVDFEQEPLLSKIAVRQRGRFVVDRRDLEKLPVDPANPLLALVYDTEEDFARTTLAGHVFSAECLDSEVPFDVDLILDLAGQMGLEFGTRDANMAPAYDHAALAAVARLMDDFDQNFGIATSICLGDLYIKRDQGKTWIAATDELSYAAVAVADRFAQPVQGSAQDAMSQWMSQHEDLRCEAIFTRHPASEDRLKSCLQGLVNRYEQAGAEPRDDDGKRQAVGNAYFHGIHLHPMKDGNFRLFGKRIVEFLLVQQGLDPAEHEDPGQMIAPERSHVSLAQAQAWRRSLEHTQSD